MPSERRTHDADATGELLELSADDILESDDIDSLEAAAAGYEDAFEDDQTTRASAPAASAPAYVPAPAPVVAAPPVPHRSAPPPPMAKPASVPPFVVPPKPAPVVAAPAPPPAPAPSAAPAPVVAAPMVTAPAAVFAAPVVAAAPAAPAVPEESVEDPEDGIVTASMKTTTVPPPPNTSPLPLEESVIIAEPPLPERTLELKGAALLQLASAAAALDPDAPQQTEVLHRSAMPSSIRTTLGGLQAASPAQTRKPTSIGPVAVDVQARAATAMPRLPSNAHVPPAHLMTGRPAPRGPMSGLVLGGLAIAAIALVGVVGLGGYAATRALSDKSEAPVAAAAPSEQEPSGAVTAPPPATDTPPGPVAAAPSDPSSAGSGSPVDVSALPSAPTPGSHAAPAAHGFSAGGAAPTSASQAPVSRSASGGAALPPPVSAPAPAPVTASGRGAATTGGTALPPPPAAAAAAPAHAAVASSTGVIRVDPKLRAVTVDGSWHHANDGAVTVSCGPHRVKAGMNDEQSVNVPCGGAVSL